MSEWSRPFADQTPDDEDGRPYTDAEERQMFRSLFIQDTEATQFLLEGAGNELAVTAPAANTIRVNTGAAIVDGFFYVNNASNDLTPGNAGAGHSRRDRVILQADWAAFKTRMEIKEGTEGVVPALTQTRNTTWEMTLAWYDIDDAGAITNLTSEVGDAQMAHFGTRVSTAMLDALCVTVAKLGADAVETAKIKDLNVTTAKVADGAATSRKVAPTIELEKLDSDHDMGSLAPVQLTDLAIAVTLDVTSNVKLTLSGRITENAAQEALVYIGYFYRDAGSLYDTGYFTSTDNDEVNPGMVFVDESVAAGSYTYRVYVAGYFKALADELHHIVEVFAA